MARKRITKSDFIVSAGVPPTPEKSRVSRVKHSSTPPPETAIPAVPAPTAAVSESAAPDHDAVAALAYLYWEARGYQGGSAEEDWLRAEQELRQGHASSASA